MKAWYLDSPQHIRDHLKARRRVFEPRRDGTGAVHWLEAGDAPFDSGLPLAQYSPKQFFFAEREKLFAFDGTEFRETIPEVRPAALFGVKACDLVAIAYQDHFFREDPYYQERRRHTLLVGIDCLSPCERGFCPTVDAGPFVREGTADLSLHPPASGRNTWLLIANTMHGADAVNGLGLKPAEEAVIRQRTEAEAEVVRLFPDASHITEGVKKLNGGRVTPELWDRLGVQCFACSGCTNLCPTCSCFATYDRPVESPGSSGAFERERCWDSCLYEGFQKEASGHHPQPTPGQRVFRYWYHKFSDDYLPEFGRHGCVGCGRCEQTCLGVIGVHSIMKRIVAGS